MSIEHLAAWLASLYYEVFAWLAGVVFVFGMGYVVIRTVRLMLARRALD